MRFLLIIWLISPIIAIAQSDGEKCIEWSLFNEYVTLDSLTVLPGTIITSHPSKIELDLSTNRVKISPFGEVESLSVCYRTLSLNLQQQHYHSNNTENSSIVRSSQISRAEIHSDQATSLIKSGTLSRAINAGNRQDLSVDSYMDFRLEGDLSEGLQIRGRLYDQNIPYEPEGNTARIKNFNRIFLELESQRATISMGDIEVRQSADRFLRFNRQLMGIDARIRDSTYTTRLITGINKGKYHVNSFTGVEGMLGPYKLHGPSNEPYVIVAAGSERVFLDGEQLDRGLDLDYTIDYNLGEINFNNHLTISKYSRIRVEFEYRNLNYSRSALGLEQTVKIKGFDIFVNVYREKDDPLSNPILSPEALMMFKTIEGDELKWDNSINADFDINKPTYVQKDTTDSKGNIYQVWEYSLDSVTNHFQVNFSYVGKGNGNYVRDYRQLNAMTFKWVPPLEGNPQGDFEPYQLLKSPATNTMFSTGVSKKLKKGDELYSEYSYSSYRSNSLNTLKSRGWALKNYYRFQERTLSTRKKLFWEGLLLSEFIQSDFQPFDPFRNVEFDRYWSIDADERPDGNEWLIGGYVGLFNSTGTRLGYKTHWRQIGKDYSGSDHDVSIRGSAGKWRFDSRSYFSFMQNHQRNGEWLRLNGTLSRRGKKIEPGIQFRQDRHKISESNSNMVTQSMIFQDSRRVFIRSVSDSSGLSWSTDITFQENKVPIDGRFQSADKSRTYRSKMSYNHKRGSILGSVSLRELVGEGKFLGGQLSSRFNSLDGSLHNYIDFRTGNAWEPRRSFIYVEVPNGQGHFTWRDHNGDGIRQLDEFFEAVHIDERNYIRYYTPEMERVPVFTNTIQTRGSIRLPETLVSQGAWKSVKLNYSLFSEGKVMAGKSGVNIFHSLTSSLDDTLLYQGRKRMNWNIVYRNPKSKWNGELGQFRNDQKFWVNNGYERRNMETWFANVDYTIHQMFLWKLSVRNKRLESFSDILLSRNFRLMSHSAGSSFKIKPWNMEMGYEYSGNKAIGEEEKPPMAAIHKFRLEYNQLIGEDFQVTGRAQWLEVAEQRITNQSLAYELMEANVPGSNILWNINLTKRTNQGMDIQFLYHGRKPASTPAIHRGTVRVLANF